MVRAKRKISRTPTRQRVSLQCSPGPAAYSHHGASSQSTSCSCRCASPASFMRRTCGPSSARWFSCFSAGRAIGMCSHAPERSIEGGASSGTSHSGTSQVLCSTNPQSGDRQERGVLDFVHDLGLVPARAPLHRRIRDHQSFRLGYGDVLRDQRRMLRCHSDRRVLETAEPRQVVAPQRTASSLHGGVKMAARSVADDCFGHLCSVPDGGLPRQRTVLHDRGQAVGKR